MFVTLIRSILQGLITLSGVVWAVVKFFQDDFAGAVVVFLALAACRTIPR